MGFWAVRPLPEWVPLAISHLIIIGTWMILSIFGNMCQKMGMAIKCLFHTVT